MMRKGMLLLLTLIVIPLLLAACGGGNTGGGSGSSPAAEAVNRYYTTLVERNDEQFTQTLCADWEEQGLLEFDSFQGVETKLDGVTCAESGTEGVFTLVKCEGKIVATYSNEDTDFPLTDRVHKVRNEGGDWRVCGY